MNMQGIEKMKVMFAVTAIGFALAGCSAGGSGTTDTTKPVTPTAADLIVSVDNATIQDTGSQTAIVSATAVDASRNVLGGVTVTMVPDNNGVIAASGTTTAASTGSVTGVLSIGADKSNRTIDVVVTSGSITKTVKVVVTGAQLQATPGSAAPGTSATVQYRLSDQTGTAIASQPISVVLNGGAAATGNTDPSGSYTYTYTVPSSPTVSISATAAGVTTATTVTTSGSNAAAASGTVTSASVAANPATVNVNTAGSTVNQVSVRGLFLGAGNTPISNVRVRFDLNGDPNGIGGTLAAGTDYVYTDSNGVALTNYVPGTRGSGNQQLTVRACWSETDFAAGTCPNVASANVTVAQSGVSISIFEGNKIAVDDSKLVYTQPFTVQVVDSVGQPIKGVLVTGSVDLPRYYRGGYTVVGASWTQVALNVCDNEDINRNSVLETYSNGEKEDQNGSGKIEPYAADVAITPQSSGSDTTDAFGIAYFNLQYGQNVASWDDYTLTFSALVSGTEGKATRSGTLPVIASALTTTTSSPPFAISPYNLNAPNTSVSAVGTVTVTDPATSRSAILCKAVP